MRSPSNVRPEMTLLLSNRWPRTSWLSVGLRSVSLCSTTAAATCQGCATSCPTSHLYQHQLSLHRQPHQGSSSRYIVGEQRVSSLGDQRRFEEGSRTCSTQLDTSSSKDYSPRSSARRNHCCVNQDTAEHSSHGNCSTTPVAFRPTSVPSNSHRLQYGTMKAEST